MILEKKPRNFPVPTQFAFTNSNII